MLALLSCAPHVAPAPPAAPPAEARVRCFEMGEQAACVVQEGEFASELGVFVVVPTCMLASGMGEGPAPTATWPAGVKVYDRGVVPLPCDAGAPLPAGVTCLDSVDPARAGAQCFPGGEGFAVIAPMIGGTAMPACAWTAYGDPSVPPGCDDPSAGVHCDTRQGSTKWYLGGSRFASAVELRPLADLEADILRHGAVEVDHWPAALFRSASADCAAGKALPR
ncbi:MAG: hypothetical protein ACOZNI_35235 [Myxococcota bacterium]